MKTFLLTLFLFVSFAAFAGSYEVIYQRGKVEIFRNNKLASPPVESGDTVKVHKGGMLVLKNEHEHIKIMSDTVIKPMVTQTETLLDLVRGALVTKVTKRKFTIKTRGTVFGVRGTQFFVNATDDDDEWMCVNEGVVNVSKEKISVDVPAGKGVFVDKKAISKPQPFAWTKGINWKMDPAEGELDHKLNLKYDVLENFYD